MSGFGGHPRTAVEVGVGSSVRITHVKSWRDRLKLKAANSNRTLTSLKAALNMAVANRQCVAALAIEWNEVQPLPGDKKRRTLFLDLDQRRNLLAHCGERFIS
jgi:hypothetical protein